MLDPDYRYENPLCRIERRPDGCEVNNFRLNQWIVHAFPSYHTPARGLYVTEPIGLLAKGERDRKASAVGRAARSVV